MKEVSGVVQCHDDHHQSAKEIDRLDAVCLSLNGDACAYENTGGGGSDLFHRWFCFVVESSYRDREDFFKDRQFQCQIHGG